MTKFIVGLGVIAIIAILIFTLYLMWTDEGDF